MIPVVRWAGSKRQILGALKEYWNHGHGQYIEPFCGSACLFFAIEPTRAVLGDINPELISAYRELRADPSRLMECLKRLPVSRATYYKLRNQNPFLLSDAERAARFLYLNRLCFNGIYRTNQKGLFNVPFATPKAAVRFDASQFADASSLLGRATLVEGDFEKTLDHAESGDFVYLDPPYAVANRRVFSEYHENTFSAADLHRLRSRLLAFDRTGVSFVVSYADCEEARALLSNWPIRRIRIKRNIAGFAAHRRYAYEVLATNVETV